MIVVAAQRKIPILEYIFFFRISAIYNGPDTEYYEPTKKINLYFYFSSTISALKSS